jgi:hypothetical protein
MADLYKGVVCEVKVIGYNGELYSVPAASDNKKHTFG